MAFITSAPHLPFAASTGNCLHLPGVLGMTPSLTQRDRQRRFTNMVHKHDPISSSIPPHGVSFTHWFYLLLLPYLTRQKYITDKTIISK